MGLLVGGDALGRNPPTPPGVLPLSLLMPQPLEGAVNHADAPFPKPYLRSRASFENPEWQHGRLEGSRGGEHKP